MIVEGYRRLGPHPVRSPKHVQSESHLGSGEGRPRTRTVASREDVSHEESGIQ